MKPLAALAISATILFAQNDRASLLSVTAIRSWSQGDVTRIAVEVSGDFNFRTDRLHNPERVYFDILNSRPRIEAKRLWSVEVNDKLVLRVRVAETNPGTTRVVVDMAGAAEINTSQLANPSRLMIEVRRGNPPAIPTPPLPAQPGVKPPAVIPTEPSDSAVASRSVSPATVPVPEPVAPAAPAPSAPAPGEFSKGAKRTSAGGNSLTRALGLKVGRIVIDAGHGGHDEGSSGSRGLVEKELVLDIAQRLGKLIEDRLNAEVIYTRSDDTFVSLEGRTAIANQKKADLFLSIHANSSPFPRVGGMETYYLNFTDSKDALDVAARENASSQKSVFELQDIIHKITLHEKLDESREFAGRVQASLYAFAARNLPGQKNRGIKKAPFVVLIGANMPSVLAEIGFVSNPREEGLLKKPDYRQKLSEALYRGLARYAESLSHFQSAAN